MGVAHLQLTQKIKYQPLLENTQRSSETRSVGFAHDMSAKTRMDSDYQAASFAGKAHATTPHTDNLIPARPTPFRRPFFPLP
ncbi:MULTISPECIES: hypothetical protein [Neisseria]|uniref:hypothetical protein n=1 Tax=Neisseria TaxID=482 RepID=UPI00114C8A2E|nr:MULTISPECIES: hypothetical protein [Neisseria]